MHVRPILIPANYGSLQGFHYFEPTDIPLLVPPRPSNCHKGDLGRLLLFVGSPGMCGAAILCAKSALKSGAGLVTLLCSEALLPILQIAVPGATCIVLPTAEGCYLPEGAALIQETLTRCDAAVVGCGLGTAPDRLPLLEAFRNAACPVVWDADALTLLASHPAWSLPAHHIITPHFGEAARLLQHPIDALTADPVSAINALSARMKCHVLLKGPRTLLTDGHLLCVNLTGSAALARGGSGDILAGMLGALLCRRKLNPTLSILRSMELAAYFHGEAGVSAAMDLGEDNLLPEDIITHIRFRH